MSQIENKKNCRNYRVLVFFFSFYLFVLLSFSNITMMMMMMKKTRIKESSYSMCCWKYIFYAWKKEIVVIIELLDVWCVLLRFFFFHVFTLLSIEIWTFTRLRSDIQSNNNRKLKIKCNIFRWCLLWLCVCVCTVFVTVGVVVVVVAEERWAAEL